MVGATGCDTLGPYSVVSSAVIIIVLIGCNNSYRCRMIEITCNDRLGKKVRVKCNADDTIGDLKKLVAAQTGTKWERIILKKWYTIFKVSFVWEVPMPQYLAFRELEEYFSLQILTKLLTKLFIELTY